MISRDVDAYQSTRNDSGTVGAKAYMFSPMGLRCRVVGTELDLLARESEQGLSGPENTHNLIGRDPVEHLTTLGPVRDQTAVLQTCHMSRYVRLGSAERGNQVRDPELPRLRKLGEDRKTHLIAKPAE